MTLEVFGDLGALLVDKSIREILLCTYVWTVSGFVCLRSVFIFFHSVYPLIPLSSLKAEVLLASTRLILFSILVS